jgi:predicted Zn finger-like uncharacterized protein
MRLSSRAENAPAPASEFMHVQCPSCKTTYNVSDSLVGGGKPTFRCSRCKHVFVLESNRKGKAPRQLSSARPSSDDPELSLPFGETEQPKSGPAEGPAEDSIPLFKPDAHREREPAWTLSGDSENEPALVVPEDERKPAAPPHDEPLWWGPAKPEPAQTDEVPLSTAPYLALFFMLVAAAGLGSVAHALWPEAVEEFLRPVPIFGRATLKNNHLKNHVALASLAPRVYTIRGNREVFAISGVAVNHNAVSVRGVRLEGIVYDGQGQEIAKQTIFVGNPLSPKLLRDMEAKEVSILQELNPQRRFEIAPEQSAPFTIVFLKPPKDIKSFACRIVSVEEST